ncbi:hypothetical protein BJ875DRAFT_528698 [Amylocarpus encephaloides]|uniref:Uncharacterized protein n=1 Tax=Amylocarpus encephaloides TaxID=45428 RepID=A0A9P7Y802_9HELO|nr:hypothetical protein BJ875DRAFT_528698 [Amylocarpus encephaloides]
MTCKTLEASKPTKVQVIRYASHQSNITPNLPSDMGIDTLSAIHGSKSSLSASPSSSQPQSLSDPMNRERLQNPFSDDYAIEDSDLESIISQPPPNHKPINLGALLQPDKLTEANLQLHEIATWPRPDYGTRIEHRLPTKDSSIWDLSKLYGLPPPWDSHYTNGNSQHTSDFFGSEESYFKQRGFGRWRGKCVLNKEYWQWKEEQSRRNDLILLDRLDREIWKRWKEFKNLHPATTLTYDRVQRKFDVNKKLFRNYCDLQRVRQEEAEDKYFEKKWTQYLNAHGEKGASKEQFRRSWEGEKRRRQDEVDADEEFNKHWEEREWRRQYTKSKKPMVNSNIPKAEYRKWWGEKKYAEPAEEEKK